VSDWHTRKHDDPTISTLFGMTMDSRDAKEKALDSIRVNSEFDSNEIDVSDSHQQRQHDPTISTLLGITID
jgi:hypothetical protein